MNSTKAREKNPALSRTFSLKSDLLDKIYTQAEIEKRSVSNFVQTALSKYFESLNQEKSPSA